MKRYESIYVVKPDLPEEELEALCQRFVKTIENQGGKVVLEDRWGAHTMAYEVKKYRKGYYVLLDFVGKPGVVDELERTYRMIESVLRFVSVLKTSEVDLEALEKEQPKSFRPDESEEGATPAPSKRSPARSEDGEESQGDDSEEPEMDEDQAEEA